MKGQKVSVVGSILLSLVVTTLLPAASAQADTLWDARITVVWPQDGRGQPTTVAESRAVNIRVQPINQVACDDNPLARAGGSVHEFYLWMIRDNDPAEPVQVPGLFVPHNEGGVCLPSVEYNNVPADLLDHPDSMYRFILGMLDYVPGSSNLWIHTIAPRTSNPQPVIPTGYGQPGLYFDSRIQAVSGVDAAGNSVSVAEATRVNLAVDFFIHGTFSSVPLDFAPNQVLLKVFTGNGLSRTIETSDQSMPQVQMTTYTVNGQTYPRWVFSNVPVAPDKPYSFAVELSWGKVSDTYITIWTYKGI
jgi:hypothetical protein